jgi:hypothetical protein
MKKLWAVDVCVGFTMPVIAETREEAEDIAKQYSYDEINETDCRNFSYDAVTFDAKRLHRNLLDCLPYGSNDDVSCGNWVKKLEEEQRQALLKADLEERQRKLF